MWSWAVFFCGPVYIEHLIFSFFLPARFRTNFSRRRRSFLSFLKQGADKNYQTSTSITISITICKSGSSPYSASCPLQLWPLRAQSPPSLLINPSPPPPALDRRRVQSRSSPRARLRPPSVPSQAQWPSSDRSARPRTHEAMIELALDTRVQGLLLQQPY